MGENVKPFGAVSTLAARRMLGIVPKGATLIAAALTRLRSMRIS
jgi:hypothetical protein